MKIENCKGAPRPRYHSAIRTPKSALAFTLIELLVVVAIIALLIAILLPSLSKARDKAKGIVCMTQQRQLGLSLVSYTNSYRDHIFPYYKSGGVSTGGLPRSHFWMTVLEPFYGDTEVLLCPTAPVDYPRQWNYTTDAEQPDAGWGTVDVAWGRPIVPNPTSFLQGYDGSFCWNAWMHGGRNYPVGDPKDDPRHYKQFSSVRYADQTPLWTDGMWVDHWFRNDANAVSAPPTRLTGQAFGAGRICMDRHDYAINAVFADGGARRVELPDLWRLYWNTDSIPMDAPSQLPDPLY